MILDALDSVVEATRAGRITWEELDSGRFETTTGADIAVVTLGGIATSFFSGSDGMTRIQSVLRAAFPEWEEHLSSLERKIDEFTKEI